VTVGKRHALLWGPLFLFLVAFVLHVNQIYFMFAALGLLVPISYVLGRRKLAGLAVIRHGRSVMTAGEAGAVTLTLSNRGRLRQLFVQVRDRLPDGLESPEGGEVLVADLPSGATEDFQYTLRARRRGVYQVGPPTLVAADYLGLFRFTRAAAEASELLVYPRSLPVPDLWQRSLQGRAPHKSRRRVIGPSHELYGVREYAPGDDLRRVDWKTTARTARLMVVETEQVETAEAAILVDLGPGRHVGQGDQASIEVAATLAASLATEALGRGCTVGLVAVGQADHSVPARPDARQQIVLLEAIARLLPDGAEDLLQALVRHERELPPGCSVAVISPGMGPDCLAAAARLRALQHPVTWFALDPASFANGPAGQAAPYEELVAGLTAGGAQVVRIYGDVPLESSLWRRAHSARHP
jgi:uncharacterized protein (DUF58 family)